MSIKDLGRRKSVEIAAGQPSIQQKEIASKLNVSRQAISQYMEKLIEEGLVTSDGRSRYNLTKEAANWILKTLRELESYSASVRKTVTNMTVCAAVAEGDLNKGQIVTLEMENGILVAKSASSQNLIPISFKNFSPVSSIHCSTGLFI